MFTPAPFMSTIRFAKSLAMIAQANSQNATSLTAPSVISAGDLLVFIDAAKQGSGLPADVTPAGFTGIGMISGGNWQRIRASYKIAIGNEGGTSITGMAAASARKLLLVYRAPGAIKSLSVSSPVTVAITTADPAPQTIAAGSDTTLALGIGIYNCGTGSGVNGNTMSLTPTHTYGVDQDFIVSDNVQPTNPVNFTFDMADSGAENSLFGFYFNNIKTYSPVYPSGLSFVTSAVAAGVDSITCPSVQNGDLVVMFDWARRSDHDPTAVTPSGFTNIAEAFYNGFTRGILSAAVASSSMSGTSLGGMNRAQGGIIVQVFRGTTNPIRSFNFGSVSTSNVRNADPVAQNVTVSGVSTPLLVMGAYGGWDAIATRTFSPIQDGETMADTDKTFLKYKVYNSAPQNTSVDMGTNSFAWLGSCWISVGP